MLRHGFGLQHRYYVQQQSNHLRFQRGAKSTFHETTSLSIWHNRISLNFMGRILLTEKILGLTVVELFTLRRIIWSEVYASQNYYFIYL